MMTRKLASATTPTVEISNEGEKWTIKTISTVKSYDTVFKIGQEFDETASDGRQCKVRPIKNKQ